MKIFITGAEGFIGSHLVEKLVRKNHNVTCLVLYNSFNSWGWLDYIDSRIKKNLKVVTGDVRDEYLIKNLIKKNVDVIINLAALIGIPYSYRSPRSYFETNSLGLINILNSSINSNVKKIIQTSTSEVYGSPIYVPIDEKHLVSAQSPYAASKIAADQIALSYFKSFNLPVTILRPFNTFGPRQSLRAIVPTIITQIIKNNPKVIRLGSISPTRDLTYVDDTTEAFLLSISKVKDIGEVINIGSEFEISIANLVNKISNLTGIKVRIKKDSFRLRPEKSEVNRLVSNSKKAKEILGWRPKYTEINFEKKLKKTISWFKNKENLKFYKTDIFND